MNRGYLPHHQSNEATKCELDLHIIPMTQVCIENSRDIEYKPLSSIKDQNTIEFFVSGNTEDYIDPSNVFLHLQARIILADGTILPADAKVSPVNNFFHSLFSEVSLHLGDKIITASDQEYAYKAYFMTILSQKKISGKSYLSAEMFYKDRQFNELDPAKTDANDGITKRHERCSLSKVMDMIGKLHCDIFHQDKLLPNNLDMHLKLVLQKPTFCLLAPPADTKKYKIEIMAANLFVRKVTPSPDVLIAHEKSINTSTFKYPIRRTECRSYSIAANLCDVLLDNVFLGPIPCFVLIGIVNSDAKTGNMRRNPFMFEHRKLNYLTLHVDGVQYPAIPLQPNFGSSQWVRAYQQFFLATGQYYGTDGIDITYSEYNNGYTLYAFDLTADQSALDGEHFSLARNGAIRISMKFEDALNTPINIIVFAVFQNIIEIDKSRNVLTDF